MSEKDVSPCVVWYEGVYGGIWWYMGYMGGIWVVYGWYMDGSCGIRMVYGWYICGIRVVYGWYMVVYGGIYVLRVYYILKVSSGFNQH